MLALELASLALASALALALASVLVLEAWAARAVGLEEARAVGPQAEARAVGPEWAEAVARVEARVAGRAGQAGQASRPRALAPARECRLWKRRSCSDHPRPNVRDHRPVH